MSQDDFDRFLAWLDADPEQAGGKYEDIRRKLIRFFLCRGCGVDAEDLADRTIDRVIRKLPEIAERYEGDPFHYFLGVARNVFREWVKVEIAKRDLSLPPPGDSREDLEEKERLDSCLQKCMKTLTQKDQEIILGYYTGDKQQKIINRQRMAERLGMAPNALRIRAHRIRTKLRSCVEKYLEVLEGNLMKQIDRNVH